MSEDQEINKIAAEIMAYLEQRPMASDSLEGITHWWLMQQSLARNIEMVEQALEQLTREGRISRKTNPGSEPVFGLNRSRS